jgi:hypothetical protein
MKSDNPDYDSSAEMRVILILVPYPNAFGALFLCRLIYLSKEKRGTHVSPQP